LSATGQDLGFVHQFERGAGASAALTLLLLHGTGGDEKDLLPLGRAIAPGANLLSPRGKVLEGNMPRFFRRLEEGVFDLEDLERRTRELRDFVQAATNRYGLSGTLLVACGLSNGANIASSLLLSEPGVLSGVVLFRPMIPFEPAEPPQIPATPVLICASQSDPLVEERNTRKLAEMLERYGARVQLEWVPGGHQLSRADLETAATWIAALG
jgi:phospholipase/carboxylesterase